MIHARAALIRQAQEFFHTYLLGIYRWDEVSIAAPEKHERPEPVITSRGRKRRPERPEGRFHATVEIEFGIWRLKIEGPNECPPLGRLSLDGHGQSEGPLDAAVWRRFGEHIKAKHEEMKDVA